jgi:hypothetical protein
MVRKVLLRPLRPELDGQDLEVRFKDHMIIALYCVGTAYTLPEYYIDTLA